VYQCHSTHAAAALSTISPSYTSFNVQQRTARHSTSACVHAIAPLATVQTQNRPNPSCCSQTHGLMSVPSGCVHTTRQLLHLLQPNSLVDACCCCCCCCCQPEPILCGLILWPQNCGAAGSAATWVTEVRACLISFSDGWWPSSCFALHTQPARAYTESVSNRV
jgi:hypothetical protein